MNNNLYLEKVQEKAKKIEALVRYIPYPPFKVRLLRYYTRLNQLDKVIDILKKIPLNFPYNSHDRFHLAFSCYKLKQTKKSKKLLSSYFPNKLNKRKLISPYAKGLSLTHKERLVLLAARFYIHEIFHMNDIGKTAEIFNETQKLFNTIILKRIEQQQKQQNDDQKTKLILNAFYKLKKMIIASNEIAIIGNGPNLLEKNLGSQIDDSDIVVRMNFFHTKGFERDTGVKTDIWVTGANQAYLGKELDQSPKQILAVPHTMHLRNKKSLLPKIQEIEKNIGISYKEFVTIPDDMFSILELKSLCETPSTGMRAISFIVNICHKNINLYGFDFFKTTAHHYYDADLPLDKNFKKTKMWYVWHDFSWEAIYVQILAYQGRANIF